MLRDSAEFLIVDELGDGRMIAADRAIGITPQFQFAELHSEGVVEDQAPDQRLARAEDQFHGFGGLDQSNGSRQNSEYSAFRAAWYQPGRRRLGIQTSIAGAARIGKDARLSLEPEDGSVDV